MSAESDVVDWLLRQILNAGRYKLPNDEHVTIAFVDSFTTAAYTDDVRVRLSRIKGYGLDAFYRTAVVDIPKRIFADGKRGAIVDALVEAVDHRYLRSDPAKPPRGALVAAPRSNRPTLRGQLRGFVSSRS